jgi:hypothetical protein
MIQCEDFPACGHERGCCPRFENGVQMDMVCTCGRRLPVDNPVSICNACLRAEDDWAGEEESYDDEESDTADYPDDTPMFEDYYGGE